MRQPLVFDFHTSAWRWLSAQEMMNSIGRPVRCSAVFHALTSLVLSNRSPPLKLPGPTPSSLRKSTP